MASDRPFSRVNVKEFSGKVPDLLDLSLVFFVVPARVISKDLRWLMTDCLGHGTQAVREYTEAVTIQHRRVVVRYVRRRTQQQRAAADRQQNTGSAARRHDAPRVALRVHEVRHAGYAQVSPTLLRATLAVAV